MAAFDQSQITYLENTIQLAIANQAEQFMQLMADGKKTQDELVEFTKAHNEELQQSSGRVSALVDKANATAEEIKNSSEKIAAAERMVNQINENIKVYAEKQSVIF